jgi:hypothetical protein
VHFLHVPKTGGTALNEALSPEIAEGRAVWHGHDVRLCDLPTDLPIVFFLRQPLSRFISGFNSRLRQGGPRYQEFPWTKEQAEIFKEFRSPNELAENLSASDQAVQARTMSAFGHIGLIKSYRYWFTGVREVRQRLPQLLLIGLQESLDADFVRLKSLMSLPSDISLPSDDVRAHRSPASDGRSLSALAIRNLNAHYAWDLQFYDEICALRNSMATNDGDTHFTVTSRRRSAG